MLCSYRGNLYPEKIINVYDGKEKFVLWKKVLKCRRWPAKPDVFQYDWEDLMGNISPP